MDIIETHHEAKIDAPSGFALALAQSLAKERSFTRTETTKENLAGIVTPFLVLTFPSSTRVLIFRPIISNCHPEPFDVAQDRPREGSKSPGNTVLTPLAMVKLYTEP